MRASGVAAAAFRRARAVELIRHGVDLYLQGLEMLLVRGDVDAVTSAVAELRLKAVDIDLQLLEVALERSGLAAV